MRQPLAEQETHDTAALDRRAIGHGYCSIRSAGSPLASAALQENCKVANPVGTGLSAVPYPTVRYGRRSQYCDFTVLPRENQGLVLICVL